ncbi:hypothetical protein BDE02_08G126600 [Populus trichocarpa]|nr:hypothetical protein BDE02_08G126600 [Populus trichocarpa]
MLNLIMLLCFKNKDKQKNLLRNKELSQTSISNGLSNYLPVVKWEDAPMEDNRSCWRIRVLHNCFRSWCSCG